MKKVTVLCRTDDRLGTLEFLRELGVLHLEHIEPPESEDVETARRDLAYIRRALEILPARPHVAPSGHTPIQVVRALWKLIHERKELEEELEALTHERQRIEPFGEFDPATARALAGRGITVELFQARPDYVPPAPGDGTVTVLHRAKQASYFVMIRRGERPAMEAAEVRMPEQSLNAITRRIEAIGQELSAIEERAAEYSGDFPFVATLTDEAEDHLRMTEALAGLGSGAERRVAYLRGYAPLEHVGCIREAARSAGWGLIVDDPKESDPVPTLIRNPAWVRPIKAVFDFIGVVPGYREVDISAVFLVFFSLFFAMLVGDAGYGAVFLGLTAWLRRKMPKAPGYVFGLLTVTGLATIAWGVLTGTYFGIGNLPAPLARLKLNWLTDPETGQNNLMGLCFLIGAVQLTIAHVWNAWNDRKRLQALAQVGWLCTTWTMYFAAGAMVLGKPFPPFMLGVLGLGVLLIVLFMTPVRRLKSEWFNHVMLPLNLISNFVDVVSYIRLFAVGTATFAVAQAFNDMAIGSGINGVLHGLFAAVILLVGHTLNIVLAAMGVIVHGVRLNTLEFSGHLGMQWTGSPYRPFARSAAGQHADKA